MTTKLKNKHQKGLTFSMESINKKDSDQLNQSFDQKEQKRQILKQTKKNKYVTLEEENEATNSNTGIEPQGFSFFSSESKGVKEDDEVVVNISQLDMGKEKRISIIENMNKRNVIPPSPEENQAKIEIKALQEIIAMNGIPRNNKSKVMWIIIVLLILVFLSCMFLLLKSFSQT